MINRKGVKNRRSSKPDKVIGGKQGTKWTSVRQSRLRDQFFRKDQHNGPVVIVDPARYLGTVSAAPAQRGDDQSVSDPDRRAPERNAPLHEPVTDGLDPRQM